MVCKAIFAFKIGEKVLTNIFFKFTICVPVLYGITSSFYFNKIRLFLICMGKEERFLYEVSDFFENSSSGISIKLPFLHPFRLCFNFIAFSFVFIVPFFYFLIYKFRNSHTTTVQGKYIKSDKIPFYHLWNKRVLEKFPKVGLQKCNSIKM